jgi:hypothetical protein
LDSQARTNDEGSSSIDCLLPKASRYVAEGIRIDQLPLVPTCVPLIISLYSEGGRR